MRNTINNNNQGEYNDTAAKHGNAFRRIVAMYPHARNQPLACIFKKEIMKKFIDILVLIWSIPLIIADENEQAENDTDETRAF